MPAHIDIERNKSIRGTVLILFEIFSCVRRVYVNINDQKHRIQDKDRQETISKKTYAFYIDNIYKYIFGGAAFFLNTCACCMYVFIPSSKSANFKVYSIFLGNCRTIEDCLLWKIS